MSSVDFSPFYQAFVCFIAQTFIFLSNLMELLFLYESLLVKRLWKNDEKWGWNLIKVCVWGFHAWKYVPDVSTCLIDFVSKFSDKMQHLSEDDDYDA